MENPTLTIRIPKNLKQAIAEAAEADNRSITSYTVSALCAALKLGPAVIARASAEAKSALNKPRR